MTKNKAICLSSKKEELRKLYAPTCEMLHIDYDELFTSSYIYLSEIYNRKEVGYKIIHELYSRINKKYNGLKPLEELLKYGTNN